MFPCEPSWIYPFCSSYALNTVILHDAREWPRRSRIVIAGFRESFDRDFMRADGRRGGDPQRPPRFLDRCGADDQRVGAGAVAEPGNARARATPLVDDARTCDRPRRRRGAADDPRPRPRRRRQLPLRRRHLRAHDGRSGGARDGRRRSRRRGAEFARREGCDRAQRRRTALREASRSTAISPTRSPASHAATRCAT